MNTNNSSYSLAYTLLISIFLTLFLSCKKDEDKLLTPITDISGKWIIIEKIDEDCSGVSVPNFTTETVEVQQNNNELSINFIDRNYQAKGQISGDKVNCNTSIPNDNASLSVNFSGTLETNLISLKGNASWNLNANSYNCNGTAEVKAMKLLTPTADASGYWEGTWTTEKGSSNFTFQISQKNNVLSGIVPLPGIITPDILKGVITGNTIIFGNGSYDYHVFFIGDITGSNVSGTYYSIEPGEVIVGSWNATKDPNINIGKVELADSINCPFPIKKYSNIGGMVITNSNIFLANKKNIFKYDRILGTTDSILSPFGTGNGLAYDGNNLMLTKVNSIYKFSPDGNSVIAAPIESYHVNGLTFDGEHFWVKDYQQGQPTNIKIHQFNTSGQLFKTIPCANYSENYGLASDDKYLWYTTYDKIIKSDYNGNIISTHSNPNFTSISGITYDGNYLWFGSYSQNKIWKTDTAGTIIATITSPDDYAMGLFYKNSNLWYLYGSSSNEKLAKLNATGGIISQKDVSLFAPTGLAFDGQYFWLANDEPMSVGNSTPYIYRFNKDLSNYLKTSVNINYLTYDNGYYWAMNGYLPNIKISKIDSEGVVVSSFEPPQSAWGDLASDGTNLWLSAGTKIYKTDKQGNILAIYYNDSGRSVIQFLAFDGQDLWCFDANNTNRFYKLKLSEK